MKRRHLLASLGTAALSGNGCQAVWAREAFGYDVTGSSPSLAFSMPGTPNGRVLTQADFRGDVTMLYFGYTFCPDVCPLTLQNVAAALAEAGPTALRTRVLFATVDPDRDTVPALTQYLSLFGPQFVGLRGDANALARLANRYRIAYSVDPSPDPAKYAVSHSSVIYLFDRQGDARLLVPDMARPDADIDGLAAALTHIGAESPSWWSWWRRMA